MFSTSTFAGVIELSFPWGKESSCSITAQYWDGKQETYTCSKKFTSSEQPDAWGKGVCSGKQAINNLQHRNSLLVIYDYLLGEFKVTDNRGQNIARLSSWFVNETKVEELKFKILSWYLGALNLVGFILNLIETKI